MAVALFVEPEVDAVRIETTIPAGANRVTISRTGPSGTAAAVRRFSAAVVGAGPLIARDFEAPIGVPLTYTVSTWTDPNTGAAVVTTATITIASQGCSDTWLTDLVRPANTLRTIIASLPELAHSVPASVHWILGRRPPIVTSDVANTPTFELSVLTETDTEREATRALLGNGVPVLLRTPPENGIGNVYFAVLAYTEQRLTSSGTLPARRFVISSVQVARPDPGLYVPLAPTTYAHVKASFATYAALLAARATYDALAYDYSGRTPEDVVPWPPDDV